MSIPESQLETWSHQGAVTTAKATHESIRQALKDLAQQRQCEVYLQGSYANDTNIRGDSDVDLVVQLNSVFHGNTVELTESDRTAYEAAFSDSQYTWLHFHNDVLRALRAYYGADAVTEGNKSLKVKAQPGRLPADVVVCMQYRKYRRFRNIQDQDFVEGMTFLALRGNRWIVNYPKLHYSKGVAKHGSTAQWYKPVIRICKNARTYMVDRNVIAKDLAPSYFVESLLHNVPDGLYGKSYKETYLAILAWLVRTDMKNFMCRNGQLSLFGSTPEQWSMDKAQHFVMALIDLWDKWGR